MKEIITLLFMFLSLNTLHAASNPIIPKPLSYQPLEGDFTLSSSTTYSTNTALADNAVAYLQQHLASQSKYELQEINTSQKNNITFIQAPSLIAEAYSLDVGVKDITITANSASGFFYGTISLMQLMPTLIWSESNTQQTQSVWTIPACSIKDTPHFKWRGMMLDSARNFFSKAYVKKFIDRMAQHKLNVFHWHLTDDEGWRIEIKKYPLLTQVGSRRGPGTKLPFSYYPSMRGPKDKVQEGYYTQDDIREIVHYASKRSVQVLPEIDVPGHAKAAVIAYGELLQDKDDKSSYTSVQKVSNNTIDPGLESTYHFLEDVITEVSELFTFKFIHLGGDEIPKGAWKSSPAVVTLMQQNGLKSTQDVQDYFFTRMEKILTKHNRKMVAWQEVRKTNKTLSNKTIIMAWRGDGVGIKAAKNGHKVIMSPAQYLYFDQQYAKGDNELGHTWAGPTDTKKAYSYNPTSKLTTSSERDPVQGVHGCLWSETALNEQIADYLAWPRMLALSEIGWSKQVQRDWNEFKTRIDYKGLKRLRTQHINYREPQ